MDTFREMVRTRIMTRLTRLCMGTNMPMHNCHSKWSQSPNLRSLLNTVSEKWSGQELWDGRMKGWRDRRTEGQRMDKAFT